MFSRICACIGSILALVGKRILWFCRILFQLDIKNTFHLSSNIPSYKRILTLKSINFMSKL